MLLVPEPRLKFLQRQLLKLLEPLYSPRDPVHGFVGKRSAISNANAHQGRPYLLNLDLQDFFATISRRRVKGMLQAIGIASDVADAVCALCVTRNQLPQGAPTSPLLANMVTFRFVFVDPKGWRVAIEQLGSLLRRENTEVVFNFMFEFINRAASITDPIIIQGLRELMPYGSWQEELAAIPAKAAETSQLRRAVLVKAFAQTLRTIGNYPYVAETPILRPLKDRTLYSLFYATRHPTGIEVFRNCQFKTLR